MPSLLRLAPSPRRDRLAPLALLLPSLLFACSPVFRPDDAHFDAGKSDARDAGPETGPPEASSADVSPPDASPADAGPLDAPGDTGPLTTAQSFVVSGTFTHQPSNGALPPLFAQFTRHDFTARLEPSSGQLTLSSAGRASRIAVTGNGFDFAARAPFAMSVPAGAAPICGSPTLQLETLSFNVTGGVFTGRATGRLSLVQGDVAFDVATELALSGAIDRTPPSLGSGGTGVDPLATFFVPASEALPAGTSARLVASGHEVALTPFVPQGTEVVAGFHLPARTALLYGTTYTLTTTFADLAGNPGMGGLAFTTAAAPELIESGGFESSAGPLVGGAALVDASYLPPVSGQRSVFLAPNGPYGGGAPGIAWNRRFTVRLPAAGKRKLSFAARPVATVETAVLREISARIATPGGEITTLTVPSNPGALMRHEIPDARGGGTLFLGKTITLTSALPTPAPDQIVVEINVGYPPQACGLFPPTFGLLLDDFLLE